MEEHRQIVTLGPVLLEKDGLVELERVISQDLTPRPDSLRIRLCDGARTVAAGSIDQLFQLQLPASTGSLWIDILSWNQQNEVDVGVSLRLEHSYADYQLHALSEARFLGKKAQLDRFFRRHRPWYAIINKFLPIAGPALSLSALFATVTLVRQGATVAAVLSAALFVVSAIVVWLGSTGRFFPHVRVRLTDRKIGRSAWEVTTLSLQVALLIATIVSILLPLVRTTPN